MWARRLFARLSDGYDGKCYHHSFPWQCLSVVDTGDDGINFDPILKDDKWNQRHWGQFKATSYWWIWTRYRSSWPAESSVAEGIFKASLYVQIFLIHGQTSSRKVPCSTNGALNGRKIKFMLLKSILLSKSTYRFMVDRGSEWCSGIWLYLFQHWEQLASW